MDIAPCTGEWADTGLWDFLQADDLSGQALRFVPDRLDVLFIDTNHRYEHTLAELRAYVPRVRPGGVVLAHDVELTIWQMIGYGEPGAAEDASGPEYPVAAALDVYCEQAGLKWFRQAERPNPAPGRPFYGLGTIEIPGG